MDSKQQPLDVLTDIRSMMQKSSRFLSLSGWSGIWAGITALVSATIAHTWLADENLKNTIDSIDYAQESPYYYLSGYTLKFVVLAIITLIVACLGALFFTYRKNKKEHQDTFTPIAKKLMVSMLIPLAAAGWMCLFFLHNGDVVYLAPATLIFYGLTLINSSKYTFKDIRYLGLCEVILGCIAMLYPGLGLYFWAFGFGVLHIVYGIVMWSKYDRK